MRTIQEEIRVDDDWIEEVIESWEEKGEHVRINFGNFSGGKEEVIREIKNDTPVGRQILLMRYNFEKELPRLLETLQ